MATADDILAESVRAPDDDHPRLVWADAVGGERGELVALQCGRGDAGVDHRARNVRERALLAAHGLAWSGLAEHAIRVQYRRGFVDAIEVDATVFAERGEAIVAAAPLLESITLVGLCENDWRRTAARERLERVLRSPAFKQIRGLAIVERVRDVGHVLKASGVVGQLRALELPESVPPWLGTIDRLERVVASRVHGPALRAMPELRSLDVSVVGLGVIRELEHLVDLCVRCHDVRVLHELAVSPLAERIERLALRLPPLGPAEVQMFTRFPRLRTLELLGPGIAVNAFVALDLPALRELHLCAHDATQVMTIEARFGSQLDVLVTPLTPRDVELLDTGVRVPGRYRVRRAIGDAHREPAWIALTNGKAAGTVWPLHEPARELQLGRANASDVHLAFDTVARRHASLEWHDGRYWLTDHRSDNGTHVAGKPINVAPLYDGVRFQLGRAELVFYSGDDGEARARNRPSTRE